MCEVWGVWGGGAGSVGRRNYQYYVSYVYLINWKEGLQFLTLPKIRIDLIRSC
ncbi:MAG: hypothetical protein F6J99_39690 [Moorea sp. SIO4G3]|nr:hypothetical protein [Moorena sp. SIO4G3]